MAFGLKLLPGWHPLVVHFPLALIVTATLALTLARLLRNERVAATLALVGTWNLCAGAVVAYLALGTGLAAVIGLHVGPAAQQAISLHVKAAVVTSLLVTLLAIWRGVGTNASARPTWMFLLVLWVGTLALVTTGYRGGQNVYRYGVGVDVASGAASL